MPDVPLEQGEVLLLDRILLSAEALISPTKIYMDGNLRSKVKLNEVMLVGANSVPAGPRSSVCEQWTHSADEVSNYVSGPFLVSKASPFSVELTWNWLMVNSNCGQSEFDGILVSARGIGRKINETAYNNGDFCY